MLTCMCFGVKPEEFPFVPGETLDLAVTLEAREFRGDGSKLMNTFQRWAARTILCSAAVAVVISILICRLLT